MQCPLYLTNHLNTGPVHKKTILSPFFRYSNGRVVRYSNGIQILDHLESNLLATIWYPTSLVFRSPLYNGYLKSNPSKNGHFEGRILNGCTIRKSGSILMVFDGCYFVPPFEWEWTRKAEHSTTIWKLDMSSFWIPSVQIHLALPQGFDGLHPETKLDWNLQMGFSINTSIRLQNTWGAQRKWCVLAKIFPQTLDKKFEI